MPPYDRRSYPKTRESGSRATNPHELEGVDLVNKFLDFLVQELKKNNRKSSFINTLREAIKNSSPWEKRINFQVDGSVFKDFLRCFLEQINISNKATDMAGAMTCLISVLSNGGFVVVIEDGNRPNLDNYQITSKLIRELKEAINSNKENVNK